MSRTRLRRASTSGKVGGTPRRTICLTLALFVGLAACRHGAPVSSSLPTARKLPVTAPWPIEHLEVPSGEPTETLHPCTVVQLWGDPHDETFQREVSSAPHLDTLDVWSYDDAGRVVLHVVESQGRPSEVTRTRFDDDGTGISYKTWRSGTVVRDDGQKAWVQAYPDSALCAGDSVICDSRGLPTMKFTSPPGLPSAVLQTRLRRDELGRIVEEVTMRRGEADEIDKSKSRTIAWAADGRSATWAHGDGTVSSASYDEAHRLTALHSNRLTTAYSYGPLGDLARITETNHRETGDEVSEIFHATFDADGRLSEMYGSKKGPPLRFGYSCLVDGRQTWPIAPKGWTTTGEVVRTRRERVWETFDAEGHLKRRQLFHLGLLEGPSTWFEDDGRALTCTFAASVLRECSTTAP